MATSSRVRLTIGEATTILTGEGMQYEERFRGLLPRERDRVRLCESRLQGLATARSLPSLARAELAYLDEGRLLTQGFLPTSLAERVGRLLLNASPDSPINLGIEVASDVAPDACWDTLLSATWTGPLGLHPAVAMYRVVRGRSRELIRGDGAGCRVLFCVAAPADDDLPALDHEREWSRLVDAVDEANVSSTMSIVEPGTRSALAAAVAEFRPHVVHLSSHGRAGRVLLESDAAGPVEVGGDELAELLASTGCPHLVVLAACATSVPMTDEESSGLPSVASALVAHGIPAVIAHRGPLGDAYSIEFTSGLYRRLLAHGDVAVAFSSARRALAAPQERATDDHSRPNARASERRAEWTIPMLLTAGRPVHLPVGKPSTRGLSASRSGGTSNEPLVGRRNERVALTGHDPYGLTAELQVYAAERAIAGAITARGVVAPSVAFPPREALAALAHTGLSLLEPA